jgi:hypothetical protein
MVRAEQSVIVRCVGDPSVPPRGTPDDVLLIWCEEHGFFLVTNNRASIPVHLTAHLAANRHVPGIFMMNASMTIGQHAAELLLIADTTSMDDHTDLLQYLPLRR